MECCKSENTFIFAWTPERIRWAEVRRYAYTGGDKPVKPRRSADPEIAHAAQHGVPLYRVSYSGNAVMTRYRRRNGRSFIISACPKPG